MASTVCKQIGCVYMTNIFCLLSLQSAIAVVPLEIRIVRYRNYINSPHKWKWSGRLCVTIFHFRNYEADLLQIPTELYNNYRKY